MAVVRKKTPSGETKKRGRPVKESFTLPTTRSSPKSSMGDYTVLFFGEKKIGKTMVSAEFPDAFHCMFEPGGRALKLYQHEFSSWALFKDAVRKLEKNSRFKTVVIDTADKAFKAAEAYICEKLVIDDPSEEQWGRGWRAIRKEFEREIDRLLASGKGVVFISHAREEEITSRGRGKIRRVVSTMPGQAREIIEAIVDVWIYCTYDGRKRVFVVQGDEEVSAGHRLDGRFRWDGKALKTVRMGMSASEAFKNLHDAFDNKYNPNPKSGLKLKSKS